MALSEKELDRFYNAAWTIVASKYVTDYIIGFTGQSLRQRFLPYATNKAEGMAILCDKLDRADAIQLERYVFERMKKSKGEEEHVVWKKYAEDRRDINYMGSYGGRGDPDSLTHSVYVVWWY